MTRFRDLWRDSSAASGAEFALVLPILLLLLFGIIDAGRFMWEFNRAEKATQMGVRYAAVTDLVMGESFKDYSFSIFDGVPQGSAVPTENFDNASCDDSSCSCDGGDVCGEVTYDGAAFGNIVTRMSAIYPQIEDENVVVEYRNVGLGYAGDPNGPDVAPLVTVKLQDLEFQPLTCLIFACSIGMPDFRASVTGEDLSGSISH
jgi:hypothetical protein